MAQTDNQDFNASVCKSTPNGLNNLNNEITNCTSSVEQNRNLNFAANTLHLQQDINSLTGIVGDSMLMADSMFGNFSFGDILKQVKARNNELKIKKESLMRDVDKSEAIIERSDRDFSDVKDTLPQPYPKKVLHFIEDYTLAILSISYLFMIITIIYIYVSISDNKLIAFGKGIVGATFLTIFLFMLLFYIV
jgi:hypothetical protein